MADHMPALESEAWIGNRHDPALDAEWDAWLDEFHGDLTMRQVFESAYLRGKAQSRSASCALPSRDEVARAIFDANIARNYPEAPKATDLEWHALSSRSHRETCEQQADAVLALLTPVRSKDDPNYIPHCGPQPTQAVQPIQADVEAQTWLRNDFARGMPDVPDTFYRSDMVLAFNAGRANQSDLSPIREDEEDEA
jgi:hypothetical protein